MSDSPELKPCPFCGSDMQSFAGMVPEAFAKGKGTFAVGCDCEAIGPFWRTMEGAVDAWNTRADIPNALVAAAYEAAVDACGDYPRVAPDRDRWEPYDEQIEYSQECIRALTPADAQAALDALVAEKVREALTEAAYIASNACLVPPDGGNPTEYERLVCDEASRRILALRDQKEPKG